MLLLTLEQQLALTRKTRRERQDASKFKALIAAPALLTTVLPATGMFAIAAVAGKAAGAAVTIVGPRTHNLQNPLLAANQRYLIGRIERKSTVTIAAGLDLYVDVGNGKFKRIIRSS